MRYVFALTVAALCTVAVAAQTPAPQGDKPAAPSAQASSAGKVTFTGCLKPGAGADTWTLENAEMAGKSTAATSGSASRMTLGLTTKPSENLKPHANHKIEVTGTVSKAAGAAASPTAPSQTLAVESFKMVSATCP